MKATTRLVALRSPSGVRVGAATTFASAVATLDANAVKVAVPAIGRDPGASISTFQWTLTSYLLAVVALLLGSASSRAS
jgi:hypothetical protein